MNLNKLFFAAFFMAIISNAQENSEIRRLQMLKEPLQGASVVLDTDTYNEIDDQFALVYALLSKESFNLEAIYAAPFSNGRASTPRIGMELSYDEILRILEKMKIEPDGLVYKGSTDYLLDSQKPEVSPAINDLIARAMTHSSEDPLYVIAIGAITNIANAILIKPEITKNIVVVWLGGHAYNWPDTEEFNMKQDKLSANVVFDSGVPLIQFPCMGVVSSFYTTVPEMEKNLAGYDPTAEYLLEIFKDYEQNHFGWSKVLWDMTAIAYMINRNWTPTQLMHAPKVSNFGTYSFDNNRHFIRVVYHINRDAIFRDFFKKLQKLK